MPTDLRKRKSLFLALVRVEVETDETAWNVEDLDLATDIDRETIDAEKLKIYHRFGVNPIADTAITIEGIDKGWLNGR